MSFPIENIAMLEEKEPPLLIRSLKKALARKYMTCLNAEFVSDFRTMRFTVPPSHGAKQRSRNSSHSTADSADLESDKRAPRELKSEVKCSSQRVHKMTELLLQFEERCFIDGILDERQVRTFRSLNRGILGTVLENYKQFRHQQTLPIGINILMFNSSKLRIPKDSFKKLKAELFPKFCANQVSTIQAIKESKTYSLLKRIIRTSR